MRWMLFLLLCACGARPIAPEEEASARWTSGDDERLEATTEGSSERADE